ncbi:MAG: hypothetical protein RH917_09940 [Lacipirellulaceae bacterium]
MYSDPVIDEIRKHRDEYAAKFNYDLKAMAEDIRRRQKESGRATVSREPKRVTHAAVGKTEPTGTS